MTFKTCAGCGDPFDASGYRSYRARCPECSTALWEANARARGRCPEALRKEALAGFIGPRLPRKNKRTLEREKRRLELLAPEGYVRCIRCCTNRLRSDFLSTQEGKIKRPCNFCRSEIAAAKRAGRAEMAGSPQHALEKMRMLERNKIRAFGLTQEGYLTLLHEQQGVCKICLKPETSVRQGSVLALAVDHCHKTGRVRGLLCSHCNKGLGHYKDDPKRLRAAADYLERDGDYPKI